MSRLKLAFLAAILALAGATSHRRKPPGARPHKADGHCQLVADSFIAEELGPVSMVPSEPIHDPELEVCFKGSDDRTRKSCCTKKMEHNFVRNAEEDFYVVIKSTSSALKDTLSENAAYYQAQFLNMITTAENQTDILLGEVYKIPLSDRHSLLQSLFTDLQAYIKQSRVNIRDTVDRFFDELFPLVFHNLLNDPSVTNLDEDYRECLTEIRQQLNPRPFGDVPHRLAHTLTQSMLSARIFLEALSYGAEAINTTDHIMLEPQCIKSIARLRYCGQCDGHIGARPCRSFCYNVMRGCLATTAEIDRHWNEYVDSVKLLTSYMQGSYNIEEVLRGLNTRISEAIMHSMETGHKFYAKLVTKCGHPKASKRAGASSNFQPVDTSKAPSEDQEATSALMGERLDTFMRSLMASKGFYHNLADTLCSHEKFATGLADQDHCWNGETLGRYNKSLVPVDLVVQMSSNPEMTVTARRSNSIVTLIDKLIHVKKLLNSKISREVMQADSRKAHQLKDRYRGYGYSGDDGYVQRDDEDFNSGSGGYGDSNIGWYPSSGQGPSYDHEYPPRPDKPDDRQQDPDIYIDDPSQEPPTYKVTRRPPGSAEYGSGTSRTIYSTSLMLVTSLLTFTGLSLWFNG